MDGVEPDQGRSAAVECVLAVDIGTQTIRSGLMGRDGSFVDVASVGFEMYSPRPGWAEQSPEECWRATLATMETVVQRNPQVTVAAIAVGAQMHGLVPVDASGESLVNRVGIWSDKRAAAIVEQFAARSDATELTAVAGNLPLPAWSGFKLAWFQREMPEVADRTVRYLVLKDHITGRLSGEATTDPSEASGTFLMDASTDTWSPHLLAALDVDEKQLPVVVPAHEVVGGVLRPVAERVGIPVDTPVVCGGGDMLCQLLAAGITRPGRVCEVSGTASILAAYAEAPSTDSRVMNLRGLTEGWLSFGIADAGGATFRWLVDHFCEPAVEEATREQASVFELLTAAAADVPSGSGGVVFLPYLLGERTMGSPHSRGSIIGLTPGHGRADVVRALLEGITCELRRTLELIDGDSVTPLRVLGGGAKNLLWNRIRAAVYGRPVAGLRSHEGGLLGAGLLAAVGAGWFSDTESAAEELVEIEQLLDPDPREQMLYEHVYARFCDLHDALDARWRTWEQVE